MSETEIHDEQVIEAVRAALDEVMEMEFGPEDLDRPLEDSGIDSLDLIEVVMVVEESLDISTSESDFEGVTTLRQAVDVFQRAKASDA